MKARERGAAPYNAFHYEGHDDRFFGKYKDPSTGKWTKIPGGPFPPEFNTKTKALAYAARWYAIELAERSIPAATPAPTAVTWPDACDRFVVAAKARVRGSDATRDEAQKRSSFLRRSPILCSKPIGEHDEALGLRWVRSILSEPQTRKGHENEPRDPLTVRNVAKVLRDIYKFARSEGFFPRDRIIPAETDEFKAEIAGALKEKAKLQKQSRVAVPTETVRALVRCEEISLMQRLMRRTSFFTGIAPGELHGLRFRDYANQHGVQLLDITQQWTIKRKDYPSRLTPLKTVHRRRKIPVHPSLQPHLDKWVKEGWKEQVGRTPTEEDFLFVDEDGSAFREGSAQTFLAELRLAKCETTHKGLTLDLYGLRHSFATIARRAGISSDARDLLLGHRPKDTKGAHYEDEDVPLLAMEIAKIPSLLDDINEPPPRPIRTPPEPKVNPSTLVQSLVQELPVTDELMAISSMISEEERRFELLDSLRHRRFSKRNSTSFLDRSCDHSEPLGNRQKTSPVRVLGTTP